ncbi:MAG: NHL repeat-containing protein [Polyangiaceae bacterium]|nr:NHL repeat-containing protein [Polyangiaceae bacterium]
MNHARSLAFFALLAIGCTGFDSQLLPNASDQEAGGDNASEDGGDVSLKSYVVSTLAGTGEAGAADGPGSQATFRNPTGIAIGPDGSLYVADHNTIRKIAVDGTVSTYAGTGETDLTDGSCAAATFWYPFDIAVDAVGNVYVADWANNAIRKIYPTPCQVITLAGAGPNNPGASDGVGPAAMFQVPRGLTLDASGNVYVADSYNNKIRKVDPKGNVTTVAGTGTAGHDEGPASSATFNWPTGIAVDTAGILYVAESINNDIRKIADDQVTTLAGSGAAGLIDSTGTDAAFSASQGIAIDAKGNLFVADSGNNAIREVTPAGEVTTIAGTSVKGADDGPADTATFYDPHGVAVSPNGVIYVADSGNNKIRKITPVGQ